LDASATQRRQVQRLLGKESRASQSRHSGRGAGICLGR